MRYVCWLWIGMLLACTTGCSCSGGAATEAELRKKALMRASDDDDAEPAPAALPPKAISDAETPVPVAVAPPPITPVAPPMPAPVIAPAQVVTKPEPQETFTPEPVTIEPPAQVATNKPVFEEPEAEPVTPAPAAPVPPAVTKRETPEAPDSRLPLPSEFEQKDGKQLLAELFKEEYDRAKLPEQKEALAKKLLGKAAEMRADKVGYYLLLKLVTDVATSAGDVSSALQATDAIAAAYQVEATDEKLAALEALAKLVRTQAHAELYLKTCRTIAATALDQEEFTHAAKALDLAEIVAKRGKMARELERLAVQQKAVSDRELAFTNVPAARSALETSPAAAHLEIGRYQCFYRRQWDEGLPHLAESSDVKLKVIAQIDLSRPSDGAQQADLGDQWCALAAQQTKAWVKRSLELRAAYWYGQSVGALPSGLLKSKVQKRLAEINAVKPDPALDIAPPVAPAAGNTPAPETTTPAPPPASEGFNNG